MFSYFLVDWLRVLAKRRAAPQFSVNARCSKQLFLLHKTQLFSFVELQLFLLLWTRSVLMNCSSFLWTQGVLINCFYYIELNCSHSLNFKCSYSSNFNCSHLLNFKYSCSLNFKCSYCCELQVFLLLQTSTVLITSN